jgi:hypothetical protein
VAAIHDADEIYLYQPRLCLDRDRLEGAPHAQPGHVHPDIDATEALHGGRGERLHLPRVRDVGHESHGLRGAGLLAPEGRLLHRLLAPRRAKAKADANPMPLDAPAITTIRSRRLRMAAFPGCSGAVQDWRSGNASGGELFRPDGAAIHLAGW